MKKMFFKDFFIYVVPIENSYSNCYYYCHKAAAITFLLTKLLTPSRMFKKLS
jgi:hypothetical protein